MVAASNLANLLHQQIEEFLNFSITTEEFTRWAFETDSAMPFFINAPLNTAGYILFLEKITENEDELHQYELKSSPCEFLFHILEVLNRNSVWEEAMHLKGQIFSNAVDGSVAHELMRHSPTNHIDPRKSYKCDFTVRVEREKVDIKNVNISPL